MPSIQRPALPRVVIAGLGGDSGKTLVSLGVVRALVERGRRVAAFKKGPDFIDAAWLEKASRRTARNLDTFLNVLDKTESDIKREYDRVKEICGNGTGETTPGERPGEKPPVGYSEDGLPRQHTGEEV